ncbi:hypothetical protein TTHERM_00138330 (macronuclear) [Tetrahymena thermophila SB210]|uniref:Uncharacterized protein n=1 Tax=Tetrahymena thermophila (strain SB210) TaxID=312017 RepID=I7M8S4_TETTS|nr:hypothetical protein TTHERM_00138330 [Tetrahymena thermophila SB210]EAR99570.1 hypothetical protein TTHERM_00138330 [Tetrahymena thermophila SB210]|eukprot:XP_001019815.1 hypothetical protein TTHERM_00138330 [Tetrahymena thermophila SB210]
MNNLFIEDNNNIIKAGLIKRSQKSSILYRSTPSSNKDIIKQTLDIFQSIKRQYKRDQSEKREDNEEQNNSSIDSNQLKASEEQYLTHDHLIYSSSDIDEIDCKDDYHSIWDNDELILNGIFDLDKLNIYQLYKVRALTYQPQNQQTMSNQKILYSFQSLYKLIDDMRKKKRQRFTTSNLNFQQKYDLNVDDWKSFQNDQLQIVKDLKQADQFKTFEDYYSNYVQNEKLKRRELKYNRYEEAFLNSQNSLNKNKHTQQRAIEALKRKFLMEHNDQLNPQQDDKNLQLNEYYQYNNSQINKEQYPTICQRSNLAINSLQSDKIPKHFQIKRVLSTKQLSTESSLNSPKNKGSKDNHLLFSSGNFSNFNSSSFNTSNFSFIGARRVDSIDFSNQQKPLILTTQPSINIENKNGQKQNFNNIQNNNIQSLKNLDVQSEETQLKESSPQKKRLIRYQSQEALQGQDFISTNRENFVYKQTQSPLVPQNSLRFNLDNAVQQKLFINTSKIENSPIKCSFIPISETAKNSPTKISQFNQFQMKNNNQHEKQFINFLPKLSFQSQVTQPEIKRNKSFLHNQQICNQTQRMETVINDRKTLSSSKSVAKQVFNFDKYTILKDSPQRIQEKNQNAIFLQQQ